VRCAHVVFVTGWLLAINVKFIPLVFLGIVEGKQNLSPYQRTEICYFQKIALNQNQKRIG